MPRNRSPFALHKATLNYRVTNTLNDTASIYLYDEIGGWWGITAADFIKDLMSIDAANIDLHISSPGGDVYDAIAMYNALKQHKATVTTYIDGIAASAASYIALAGKTVKIARNAEMMIHDAWGFCMGPASEMTRMASDLDRVSNNIADIYNVKAGGKKQEWRDAMLAETWYTGAEAVKAGLADEVVGESSDDDTPASDKFNLSVFAYAGRGKAPEPWMPENKKEDGLKHSERVATFVNENAPVIEPSAETPSFTFDPEKFRREMKEALNA